MGTCLSWKYLSLLLSLLFFHSQFPFSSSLSSNSQCSALLHFNHSLSLDSYASSPYLCGSNYYPKTGSWKEDKDCCTWDGVVCDNSTCHVIALDLTCSWLYGSIHSNSTLFLLRHLRTLNLAGNDFNLALISPEFGKFQSLTHLNLSRSNFYGEIPYEISQFSSLVSLDLSYNFNPYSRSQQLSLSIKTPVWKRVIGNLTQLRELVLDGTDMSSITPNSSMMNLSSSLTTLSLRGCSLQGTFEITIFRLPCIQTVDLGDNWIEGSLLKSNWSSTSLKILSLSKISFSGELPDSIGSLKSLEYLSLAGCNFTGAIPTSLGNLTQIIELDLSFNSFNGLLPWSIFDLLNLSVLYFHHNQLVGPLPNDQPKMKHKGKHDKPKPWDDDPNIDHWKIDKFNLSWNETGMLEVCSFSILFPRYREKYLQEVWPTVKPSLKEYGISCELNLVEGSMTVNNQKDQGPIYYH